MKRVIFTIMALLALMQNNSIYAQNETYVSEGVSIGKNEKGNGLSLNVNGLVVEITEMFLDKDSENDSEEYSFSYSYNRPKRRYESRVPSAEFGFNHFSTANYALYPEHPGFMDMRMGRSFHFATTLFSAGTGIDRRAITGLSTAIRLVWNKLYFDNQYTITKEDGMLKPVPLGDKFEKSKIKTFGIQVPLYLDININKASVSLGGYGGVVLSSKTKLKSPKVKDKLSYVNPFEYGLSARMSWDNDVCIFVNYPLSNFFVDGKGLDSRMLTVGIGF